MSDHYLKLNIEEEIYNIVDPDEEFTPEEIDLMVEEAKENISYDEMFWDRFTQNVNNAVYYVKRRRNKINEQY